MSIDITAIQNKLISVAREPFTTELSFIGQNGDIPAVILHRPEGPNPNYPYITFDVLQIADEQGWMTDIVVDINDNPNYITYKSLLTRYRCYGGGSKNIMNNLHGHFRLERVRDDIGSTLGGSIVEVLDIDDMPIRISDKYLESSSFTLIFNIMDTIIDTGTGIIDNVNISGELFRDDEDPNPLPMTIIAP